jgi:hypothetical protein
MSVVYRPESAQTGFNITLLGVVVTLWNLLGVPAAINNTIQLAEKAAESGKKHRKLSVASIVLVSLCVLLGVGFRLGSWVTRRAIAPAPPTQVSIAAATPAPSAPLATSKDSSDQTTPAVQATAPHMVASHPIHHAQSLTKSTKGGAKPEQDLPSKVNDLMDLYYKTHPGETPAVPSQAEVDYVNAGLKAQNIPFNIWMPASSNCVKHGIVSNADESDFKNIESNACITEDVIHATGKVNKFDGVVINSPKSRQP